MGRDGLSCIDNTDSVLRVEKDDGETKIVKVDSPTSGYAIVGSNTVFYYCGLHKGLQTNVLEDLHFKSISEGGY